MVAIDFEIVGARQVVDRLIALHRNTMYEIEAGKKFHKGRRDVTAKMYAACKREEAQCLMAREALAHMSMDNVQRARELLNQIKEYLPSDH